MIQFFFGINKDLFIYVLINKQRFLYLLFFVRPKHLFENDNISKVLP